MNAEYKQTPVEATPADRQEKYLKLIEARYTRAIDYSNVDVTFPQFIELYHAKQTLENETRLYESTTKPRAIDPSLEGLIYDASLLEASDDQVRLKKRGVNTKTPAMRVADAKSEVRILANSITGQNFYSPEEESDVTTLMIHMDKLASAFKDGGSLLPFTEVAEKLEKFKANRPPRKNFK